MVRQLDTIFALSSGSLPSGVAVVRVSGSNASSVLAGIAGVVPPWRARLRRLRDASGLTIDHGLVLWFPSPRSFTGEDVCEFHVHGGRAVVHSLFGAIAQFDTRLAAPGEFSRRAFDNGKLDLTQVEGLADLIAAETEMQRRQAVEQSAGRLRRAASRWREQLIELRALAEARLDFSDEPDVGDIPPADHQQGLSLLRAEIAGALAEGARGEMVREGFRVAILGPPNAGKSSLLNALAGREVAIVTPEAGTTRDVLEVSLDLDGHKVRVSDTAGLREAESAAEKEGIRRARNAAATGDLVLWTSEASALTNPPVLESKTILVATKTDLWPSVETGWLGVSVVSGQGIPELMSALSQHVAESIGSEPALATRQRQREALGVALSALDSAASERDEMAADSLRHAGTAIARLSGAIDIEAVLDRLFGEFCIGK